MTVHDKIRLIDRPRGAPTGASRAFGRRSLVEAGEPPAPGSVIGVPEVIDSGIARTWIQHVAGDARDERADEVAVEEPLEIRVDGRPLAVTMRTPGHDDELAVGFLVGEGLIDARGADVTGVGPTEEFEANVVDVRTRGGLRRDPFAERRFHMTSSCGVCGKGALEQVRVQVPADLPERSRVSVDPQALAELPDRARSAQAAFERTGSVHSTALFAASGELLCLHEDVGRHNAMDKAVGQMVLAGGGVPDATVACLSGRIAFELVQKAVMAGVSGIVAVGAPTSLAIELAEEHDLLLCGFVRHGEFNVYAGQPSRL